MEAVDRLRRVAGLLGDEDADWAAGVLNRYLDPCGTVSVDEALGLVPAPGEAHWRTAARRALRDDAIRALAGYFPGLKRSQIAEKIRKALIGFATTRWRVDRERSTMPEHYAGTKQQYLWAALVAGGGKVLGEDRIRHLLGKGSDLFVTNRRGDNPAHDSSRTDDRRRPGQDYSVARQERDC